MGLVSSFYPDTTWRDGVVAIQSYLAAIGIKMEINYLTSSAFTLIRTRGKIEKGAAAYAPLEFKQIIFTRWIIIGVRIQASSNMSLDRPAPIN